MIQRRKLPSRPLLTAQTRDLFRPDGGVETYLGTWTGLGTERWPRSRPGYRTTNPALAGAGWRAITETIADYRDG